MNVYEMEIEVKKGCGSGNILILNLGKVWPERGYKDDAYHAVFVDETYVNEKGEYMYHKNYSNSKVRNSWGDNEKVIAWSDIEGGYDRKIHQDFEVEIKSLTYKGYEIGDIPILWRKNYNNGGQYFKLETIYDK